MKRKLAMAGATLSGLYLLTLGILPDPLPFVDEAFMLMIFVKSTAALGFDVSKILPFLGKRKSAAPKPKPKGPARDAVLDV